MGSKHSYSIRHKCRYKGLCICFTIQKILWQHTKKKSPSLLILMNTAMTFCAHRMEIWQYYTCCHQFRLLKIQSWFYLWSIFFVFTQYFMSFGILIWSWQMCYINCATFRTKKLSKIATLTIFVCYMTITKRFWCD